jgi:calcineurin-like phosphoesterase family protein
MIRFDKVPYKKVFFLSDPHFGHANVVRGTSKWTDKNGTRDFNTIEEHDSHIIDNINQMVGPKDLLLCFGDWSFGGKENAEKYRKRIICENIGLILGNHDHHIRKNKVNHEHLFVFIEELIYLCSNHFNFVGCHYPIAEWHSMGRGVAMLHGHSHGGYQAPGKILDIGVDEAFKRFGQYRPFTQEEVEEIINSKEIHNIGHH